MQHSGRLPDARLKLRDYLGMIDDVLLTQITNVDRCVAMQATVLGSDRSGLFVISDVWLLQNAEWRIGRRHSTPMEAGEIPGAA